MRHFKLPTEIVIGLQAPPESGYSEEYFASLIAAMERQFEDLNKRKDSRAVFQLTYLTFSKHVYENLLENRFYDKAWATDMCCRFIEIYLKQMHMWEEKSAVQCKAWREALMLMEKGKLNVLQCMFLGMNAHINYDLAFCTLGACIAQGDIERPRQERESSLHQRTSLQHRYRDYLQINHVGWKSITHIQDEVLNRFHPILGVFNRWATKISKPLSLRVLMASRDQAWRRTVLLMNAQSMQEAHAFALLIDHAALRWSHAIQTISINPIFAHRALRKWQSGEDITREPFFQPLLDALKRETVTNHLLMAELAFTGANAIFILEELRRIGQHKKVQHWTHHIIDGGTNEQFDALLSHFSENTDTYSRIISRTLVNSRTPKHRIKPILRLKALARQRRKNQLTTYLAKAGSISNQILTQAIQSELKYIQQQNDMQHQKNTLPQPLLEAMSNDFNPWLSHLAQGIITHLGGTLQEEPVVESVLFLKDCYLFSSVETEFLYEFSKHLESRSYRAGEAIIRSGDAPIGMWFIKYGKVEISGTQHTKIAEISAYDVLGELSCIGAINATAHAIAKEQTEAYFIKSSDFLAAIHDVPEIAINLMQIMGRRLAATTHTLAKSEALS